MYKRPVIKWILCLTIITIACNDLNLTHSGDTFYYYPSKNVYYDVKRSNYIYSLDSGKTWDSMYSETAEPAIMGRKATVYSTTSDVWKDNEAHRKLYNGILLNIINEESLKPNEPVEGKKEPEISTDNSLTGEPEKKERKRPIKKFFQKLFGKKS